MGSAFPCDGLGSVETVVFLMWPRHDWQAELVCHLPHPECAIQEPHPMNECGRFERARRRGEERSRT